jgi:peptide/nickel transport system substrate-binding protein
MERPNYWSRFSRQRLSRRRALKAGAAGLGASALILAGCGGDEEAPGEGTPSPPSPEEAPEAFLTPTGEDETPQYGGHSLSASTTAAAGLDAHIAVDALALAQLMYGYLYSVDRRDGSYDAQMAETMERVDEITYIWKLRPGIKFHNIDPTWGRELTADDVVYSYTRRRDEPASQMDKQLLRDFTDHFEAPDKYTVRFVTTRPYVPTLDELGNASYPIVPKEAVEKWGDLMQHAVGSGAYILDEFVRGERTKMVKNPDFYMEGLPYIDSRELLVIPDASTLDAAFSAGNLDSHIANGSPLNKPKVDQWKNVKGMVIREYPNWWRRTFLLKVDRPPFDDKRVRKAIDLALDRQDFMDKMWFGEGKIAGPVVPDLVPWSLPQEEVDAFYKLDRTEAVQLLSAAGHEDGLDVELTVENVSDLSQYAEVTKEQLSKIGINCKIVLQELGIYLGQTLYPGNFEMTCYYNLPYDEPDRPLCQWFSKGQAGASFSGYNNPEADEWIWKERSEFDPERRLEIIHDAQRFFMTEHGPQISTHTDRGYAAWWDWLHGEDQQRKGFRTRGAFSGLGVTTWLTERA